MKFSTASGIGIVAGWVALAASMPSSAAGVTFFTSQASFSGASSTTLVETFEAGSIPAVPRNVSLAGFTANGITYTPNSGNVFVANPGFTNFGAGVGTTTTSVLTANGDEDFTAAFSTAPTAVGFDAYFNGLGPGSVRVFGAGNVLLDTFNFSGTLDDIGYIGITSAAPIASIRWTTTLGGRLNTGIDNISLGDATTTVVPLPPALALLLGGLAVLGVTGRRNRSRGD
jgi:hypothetical protein